ncbi:WYL domain-containing protein [Nibrella viscosa]|uniref:WYL domain-containing protein n=1 Tax=Nibrella viscosa TaxID=1084524 RepID=A0ABP8KN01_9BACT
MPVNKNQLGRLLAIHNLLGTGRRYNLKQLIDACKQVTGDLPSERTVFEDLRLLREEYKAPISKGVKSLYPYHYTGEYSLFGAMNKEDAALANEAAALIRQMSMLPQFAGLEEVQLKFQQRAGVIGRPAEPVVQFEQNPAYSGLKHLQPIYEAIQQDRRLLVQYCDFHNQRVKIEFSPYLLREYSNRWFVFGWDTTRKSIINLALDRIEDLKRLSDSKRRPDDTNWNEYLADIVGVTRYQDEPVETLVLRVYLPRARYVETKPLHASQQIIGRTDAYLHFQYQLRWNRELESKLLEFGPDAELLSPTHRRQQLKERVLAMVQRYT